jgi:hypothetical protein
VTRRARSSTRTGAEWHPQIGPAIAIGVTADRDGFPDIATFVAGMEAELGALRGSL